jgi:ABC-type glycerol-3-phosphate transport system substrate-binding protein
MKSSIENDNRESINMKKIISIMLAVVITVMLMTTTCGAVTLTSGQVDAFRSMYLSGETTSPITLSAEYNKAANKITVTYETDAFEGLTDAQVTVVAYVGNTVPTAATAYEYIDQMDYSATEGTFSFTPKSTIKDSDVITVMMGGTDIDIPAVYAISRIVRGDADGNGEVTMGDASAIAQHVVKL